MQQINYPTDFMLGKPRGAIIKLPHRGLSVTFRDDEGKKKTKSFLFKNYDNDQKKTNEEMLKWRQKRSDELNVTRNRIRYLDKDTIEVQLTQGKTMKTDAKFLDKVQLFPLQVKLKKTKTKNIYYVHYQNKKHSAPFVKLITNYKLVDFINGDTLDLRSCNMKETGFVDKIIDVDDAIVEQQYNYFNMNIDNLPKNIWLLGKVTGSVFKRKDQPNIYTAVVADYATTFNVENFASDELAHETAKKWQIETSYKLGLTRNLIKIIDDETIEVELTKKLIKTIDDETIEVGLTGKEITKTNKCFISLIQKISICSAPSGNGMMYCSTSVNDKTILFHDLIMQANMIDHINRNPLDNRLINLRLANHSLNNSNRSNPENSDKVVGVTLIKNKYGDEETYRAHIKINGTQIGKSFHIKTHGKEVAKQLAIDFRIKVLEINQDNDDIGLTVDDDDNVIKCIINRINELIDFYLNNLVLDEDLYLTTIDIDKNLKKKMHTKYLEINLPRINNFNRKRDKTKKIILDKLFPN